MFKNNSNITGIFCFLVLLLCVLGCRSCPGGYYVQNEKVFYKSNEPSKILPPVFRSDIEVVGADAETFEELNKHFGRDKNKIYYHQWEVEKVDRQTFEVIEGPFSKDKNHVFLERLILTDKPQNFKVLFKKGSSPDLYFSTDGEVIFKGRTTFFPNEIDVSTFEEISGTDFMRDKDHVYSVVRSRLTGADPQTFKVIRRWSFGNTYATDKSNVFYDGRKVEGADVKTHKIIDETYHKDKNHVYKNTEKISDDPENFQVPEKE